MQIFKYRLEPGMNEVPMPTGATILSAGGQREGVFIWAMVDPDAPLESRKVYAAVTGEDLGLVAKYRFVGTVLLYDSKIVIHVFEQG